jgi:predicted DNA-binding protein
MKTLSIQLKPETAEKIEQAARRDGRPRSQYIRRLLEQHMVAADSQPRPAPEPAEPTKENRR